MELRQLQYFQTLARLEHMSAAADEIGISQPALSKSITSLESEIGMPLFDRVHNRIYLNENGRSFLKSVQEAMTILQDGVSTVRRHRYDVTGELTIMCHSFAHILTGCTIEYAELNPNIKIKLVQAGTADRKEAKQCDFLLESQINPQEELQEGDYWVPYPLFSEESLLVFSPLLKKLPADMTTVRLADLTDLPFSCTPSMPPIYQDITLRLCHDVGFTPKVYLETDCMPTILQLLHDGRAARIMPESYFEAVHTLMPELKAYKMSDVRAWRTVYLMCHKDNIITEAAMDYRDFVLEWFSHHRSQSQS